MTTLEGRYLAEGLGAAGMGQSLESAARADIDPAARPASSFNALARMCLDRNEPPEDSGPGDSTMQCPIMIDDRCPIYDYRPLACRSMVSTRVCRAGGEAVHDAWWITLSTAFFQLVEAADPVGSFGPMSAVLNRVAFNGSDALLTPCEPLPGLMAPQEHQGRLEQVLSPVFARLVAGAPLGLRIDEIRRNPL